VLGAWVVGLGAVVALAIMGAGPTEERTAADVNRATASIAVAEPTGERSISIDQPARRDQVVTTPDIVVRGEAGTDVTRIRVTLESRGNKLLASEWIDRAAGAGAAFPYEARFDARMPRPAGVMWVTATAFGADGVPIDARRRRIQLGEIPARYPSGMRSYLFPASSGLAIPRVGPIHTTGEDGVMGGIPFGTNFLPPS
jgi:hypothetical protein